MFKNPPLKGLKNMKKFFAALLCAGLIVTAFAGCGYKDALDNQQSSQVSESEVQETTVPKADEKDYDDSFDGLCNYFAKLGYIDTKDGEIDTSKEVTMDSSLVGSENGKKFKATYNGKQVTVELYSYDPNNLNDTAKGVIDSIKKDGTFSILELDPVTAYMSDNGKYMMIYTDSSIDKNNPDENSDNYKHREQVITDFKAFHK